MALMDDAVRCVGKYRHARDIIGRKRFAEEARWILSNETGWLHAFVRICEILDLDPGAVRCSLRLTAECLESGPLRATTIRVTDLKERRLSCRTMPLCFS
ncbi:MAG TPA: hypothetical protein VGK20_12940 [Candidatus Binatia bacterium]|jgi:hypothetical protein